MPSMSRCGCIGHAAPGTRRSSLKTRRSPIPMFASSEYWSKLKCQFALNQPPSAWNSDARGRRTIALDGRPDVRLELLEQLLLRHVADDPLGLAAVLEEDHRGDRADAEPTGRDRIRVDVELGDLYPITLLVRDLFEHRRDHAAGPAPCRPEVHEHGRIRFDHVRLEALVTGHLRLCHLYRS